MELGLLVTIAVAALVAVILLALLLRRDPARSLDARLQAMREDAERIERSVREEQRASRAEMANELKRFGEQIEARFARFTEEQSQRVQGFDARLLQFTERTDNGLNALRQNLGEDARKAREEQRLSLEKVAQSTEQKMGEVRATLEGKLKDIQQDNATKLEKMRETVEEKLQSTLETRLGESFRQVSERLEQVHRGLGEMQGLAAGVGDLKRVLNNVKTRGIFGEVQLSGILEDLLTPEQYAANVATRPSSGERVEYAVRLPGNGETPVWLPIDAKFPREDYERLLDAQERADAEGAATAGAALERRLREEAKTIAAKYVEPPYTTDFAILFVPTEGLYAEVLRRPGLVDALQREQRVILAGPTTLSAQLSSLRMGFRTLAIEKRSSEVWQVLGAVRTEFGKFGEVLAKTEKQLDSVRNSISQAGVRTRAIERKLRGVEAATPDDAQRLLGDALGIPELDVEESGDV